jgi:hypothetical protein
MEYDIFQSLYETRAKVIFHAAMKRLPSETELSRMVKFLKKGGGFLIGQAVDPEILDTVDGSAEGEKGDCGKAEGGKGEEEGRTGGEVEEEASCSKGCSEACGCDNNDTSECRS